MMDIYQEIVDCHAEGKPFAFATIVKAIGSVPRDVGAKMIVYPDGSIAGTIGGGNLEKLVIDESVELLKGEKVHLLKTYRLEESGPDSTGMYCGGEVEVFIEVNPRPDKLIIFGGGHIGRDLAKVAAGLNFKIIIVDERPDILAQYQKPIETFLTDENFSTNYPTIDKNSYIVIVTHGHRCDKQALANVIIKDWAYVGHDRIKKKNNKNLR